MKFLIEYCRNIINLLISAARSRDGNLYQSVTLFLSLILSMGLNFLSSVVTARSLGPVLYGDMKFIVIFWSFLTLIASLGHFYSGGRLLALEYQKQSAREISGLLLLIAIVMGVISVIFNLIIAYPLSQLLHMDIAHELMLLAPLTIALPIIVVLTLILQGSNRIYLLAMLNVIPTALFLLCIIFLNYIQQINTITVIIAQQLTTDIVALFIIWQLKPVLRSVSFWWNKIKEQNITYGTEVYRGCIASIATGQINRLSLSYWMDNTSIGFMSLASSLVEPLKILPNAVAITSFRKFASQEKISKKVFTATIACAILSLIAGLFFFGEPLSLIYTKDFNSVGAMARIASFGAILHGFGDLFNSFLGAHGKGKVLRNSAYIVGCVNVLGFFLLVPKYGAWGAIITSYLGVGITYFVYMLLFYLKFIDRKEPPLIPVIE
jgi:O-antigen/teichoic acid export membrane protein